MLFCILSPAGLLNGGSASALTLKVVTQYHLDWMIPLVFFRLDIAWFICYEGQIFFPFDNTPKTCLRSVLLDDLFNVITKRNIYICKTLLVVVLFNLVRLPLSVNLCFWAGLISQVQDVSSRNVFRRLPSLCRVLLQAVNWLEPTTSALVITCSVGVIPVGT